MHEPARNVGGLQPTHRKKEAEQQQCGGVFVVRVFFDGKLCHPNPREGRHEGCDQRNRAIDGEAQPNEGCGKPCFEAGGIQLSVKEGGMELEMGKIMGHLPHHTLVGIGVVSGEIAEGECP